MVVNDDDNDPKVFFHKRKMKDKQIDKARKRQRYKEEESIDTDDVKKTIEELLEEQKLRQKFAREEKNNKKKKKNIHSTTEKETTTASTSVDSSIVYGLHDPKKDGSSNQKLLNLLDGQFTGSSTTNQKSQHEELMKQYIEERLNKCKKSQTIEKKVTKSEEDALYELPPHLIPELSSPSTSKSKMLKEDTGVVVWSAGIAEVELPESFHQKTIKATHAALKERQERSNTITSTTMTTTSTSTSTTSTMASSTALPANFSTDFNRHRREYVQEMNSLPLHQQKDVGWFVKDGNKKQDGRQRDQKPTDHEAVSRFRKIEARKKR